MNRATLGVALALLAGCTTSNLAFVEDRRVDIVAPHDGERVSLPMTVEWRAEDIELAPPGSTDGLFFAVFVDRPPLRPGESLTSLIGDDCRDAGCADLDYFAQKDVHLTSDTSVVLDRLPPGESHQVAIVLVDQQYRRVGESVFIVEFRRDDDA